MFALTKTVSNLCPLEASQKSFSEGSDETRAAIFTQQAVVDFILDLVGYQSTSKLYELSLLEPCFGHGQFFLEALQRLLVSCQNNDIAINEHTVGRALRGVELHPESYELVLEAVLDKLIESDVDPKVANRLSQLWLHQGDFLLSKPDIEFSHVVGNPPYLRHDSVPPLLMEQYRSLFSTIYDRADLYIPFFEHSLKLLRPDGKLGFICADRWMKNRYGAKLRKFVSDNYHLETYIDMVGTPAFHSEVIAYPAITVISSGRGDITKVAKRPEITTTALTKLTKTLSRTTEENHTSNVQSVSGVAVGSEPWILDNFEGLKLIRRLEASLPKLEETGCKVRIGVATGADKAFIGDFEALDVEPDRKLPLATTKDIMSGVVNWQGKGVINPFEADGSLVDLDQYPRLKKYLNDRYDAIAGRHIAKKNPDRWYKTIDKIHADLVAQPKLLIPDIKGDALIARENGKLYPHHNLYFITSNEWDIGALQVVLKSGIARLFVGLYSTQMRGGYLRFQAQYLRRIRLPLWKSIPKPLRARLVKAGENLSDFDNRALVQELYKLSDNEMSLVAPTIEVSHAA